MAVVSVIIPAYNEIGTIGTIIDRVMNAPLPAEMDRQIIIVDDCSADGTKEFLSSLDLRYTVLSQQKNLGKGAAVRFNLVVNQA